LCARAGYLWCMSKPILTYFDFPGGRGEAARLAFHVADVAWTDDRFSGDWPEKKATTPFGGLPTLEVPGKGVLSQSNAILGYIGREHGLLPADSFEAARHGAAMNAVEELRAEAATTGRDDAEEKRKAREAFAEGYFQRWAANLSAQIQGPFLGGDTISVADLKIFVAMRSYTKGVYDHIPATILDGFPKITGLIAAVEAHPRVADWHAA
jgi:prostaglandin-H2 D-isomerase / glutathione transferase